MAPAFMKAMIYTYDSTHYGYTYYDSTHYGYTYYYNTFMKAMLTESM